MKNISEEISKVNLRKDNEKLYVKSFGLNEFDTQVILFHDAGEYHERYIEFGNYLTSKSIGITFIDMRGHGLSSGTRGHCESFEQLIEDYNEFWSQFSKFYKNKKTYVLGHGVGALLSLIFMLKIKELKGAILVNPIIKFNERHNHNLEDFASGYGILNKIKLTYNNLYKNSCEDRIKKSYSHDPLVNKKLTIGMYSTINKMIRELKRMSYFVTRPILLQVGIDDEIVDVNKSLLFASSFDKSKLTLKCYEDIGHEVFNEIHRDKLIKDIYNWIKDN